MKNSKIIATLGPATENINTIEQLIENGSNFFRFNRKYSPVEWHQREIGLIRKLAKKLGRRVGVIIDIPRFDYATDITDYDYLALSYLKTADEVVGLKERLKRKKMNPSVIAKIENGTAMENLEKIVAVSDAVMVARGDLGKETPIEELAFFQKKIIDVCRQQHRPVIVATQMLLSMTENLTPTRAEATDVSNAVFDGTDALMLSEETAIGNNPIEAVKTMTKIAKFCESTGELRKTEIIADTLAEKLILVTTEIVRTSDKWPIKAIIVFTKSGNTARILSSYRLSIPVIAISDDEDVLSRLSLSYGVIPFFKKFDQIKFEDEDPVFAEIKQRKLIKTNDNLIVVHGSNWLKSGSINNISMVKA
jgi:pyruvate kinase